MLNAWTSILQLTESIPLASLPGVARKYAREIGMIAGAFALVFVLIPQPGVSEALAFGAVDAEKKAIELRVDAMVNETRDFGTFPTSGERTPVRTVVIPTSAYNSLPNQTDSTPFIMASGNLVYDGAVASNYWPLGTKIRIPEYSGDRVFIVEDRMNSRYHKRMDIWMEDYDDAVHFGVRGLIVEIF